MKQEKLTRYQKSGIAGGSAVAARKEARIKVAARLSRKMPASKICGKLNISTATLKRYEKDPLWQENGGVKLPRYFDKKPTGRHRDLKTEKRLLTKANRLHGKGLTWKDVASQMGLKIRQLEYLRSKHTD